MRSHVLKVMGIVLMVSVISAVQALGADLGAIKERMKDRLPTIKALKVKGMVGENNEGYLEFLGKGRENESVVAAENADRKTVYEAIAAQQNVGVDVVERHRAAQIRENAESGMWLEDANGNWYRKG